VGTGESDTHLWIYEGYSVNQFRKSVAPIRRLADGTESLAVYRAGVELANWGFISGREIVV